VSEDRLSATQIAATASEITEYMGYRVEARPLGKGWRVLIYPPGAKSALSEYASDLEKGSKKRLLLKGRSRLSMRISTRPFPDYPAMVSPGTHRKLEGPQLIVHRQVSIQATTQYCRDLRCNKSVC
jgi:hypothetical protein